MAFWLLLAVVAGIVGAVLFVLLTDGRYFGKPLVRWVYNTWGPAIFEAGREPARWQRFLNQLSLQGNERVLDVGTAVGDLPIALVQKPGFHGRVVGVDWSPRMMASARSEAGRRGAGRQVSFAVVDMRAGLPFDAGAFDVVFCLGLLEALPEPERALGELRRVLSEQGIMVLSLYQGWSGKIAALDLHWYREQLAAVGLGTIEVVPCRHSHDALVARHR